MKIRLLLSCLTILLFSQLSNAQWQQPEPALKQRLQKYAADNHLYAGGTYMYFDTVDKKPYRFSPKDFIAEDVSQPPANSSVAPTLPNTTARVLGGGNFHLVKDINNFTDANPANFNFTTSNQQKFAVLNNVAYFSAKDDSHGNELWRSDGTAAGTYLIKDITPGENSTPVYNIITSGNYIFFTASDSINGKSEIWKSNGTEIGTIQVSFLPDSITNPLQLCDVNGTVYFAASKNQPNNQLWKTDGTGAGTVLVKDFSDESQYNVLNNFVSVNGLLFFTAYRTATGKELWRSDGTSINTFLLKDIDPETSVFRGPVRLTPYNNKLYFFESDGTNYKLFTSDGTTENTTYTAGYNSVDVNSFYQSNLPLTVSGNVLYFSAYNQATGGELYKYDATSTAGIELVKDITPGEGYTNIDDYNITDVNGTVYFYYYNSLGKHLYKSDGTESNTLLVKDFPVNSSLSNLVNGNGKLFFVASDSTYGAEPWISDGTEAGTVLLKDIYTGTISSYPNYFTILTDKVLFAATDSLHGSEVWVSNGNSAQLVTEINKTASSGAYPAPIVPFNTNVIFSARTYNNGVAPWLSDGNSASLIKDFRTSYYQRDYFVKNNIAYFIVSKDGSDDIYHTDGTSDGTLSLNLDTSVLFTYIFSYTVTDNGTVFYVSRRTFDQYVSLWKVDGTTNEKLFLKTFSYVSNDYYNPFDFLNRNYALTAIGNTIYFAASSTSSPFDVELWKSDGTVSGTTIVKDINPGNNGSNPALKTLFNNELYFKANDGSGNALWKSDGTTAGTIKVSSVQPNEFEVSNNTLYFSGTTSSNETELWKTDGTVAGTILVKDINSGTGSSSPANLTDVNGTLFFQASDSTHGNELWKSDGTTTGTQLVEDITPGTPGSYLYSFTAAAGKLFFLFNNNIWASDGTSNGTGVIADDVLNNLIKSNLTGNGNTLYFSGYNYHYGYELYAGDASQVVLPVSLLSFTAALKNKDVITQWQTASKINTAYFTVQRSTDGIHFNDAGKVAANGNSNTLQQYSFPDVNIASLVSAKTIYYRLQVTDKDGAISFSKVVPIDLKWKDVKMLLHPNPAKNVLKIKLNNYAGTAVIDLYDLSGKKLRTLQQTVESGNDIGVNVAQLKAGVYIIKVNMDGKVLQQKFVKE